MSMLVIKATSLPQPTSSKELNARRLKKFIAWESRDLPVYWPLLGSVPISPSHLRLSQDGSNTISPAAAEDSTASPVSISSSVVDLLPWHSAEMIGLVWSLNGAVRSSRPKLSGGPDALTLWRNVRLDQEGAIIAQPFLEQLPFLFAKWHLQI